MLATHFIEVYGFKKDYRGLNAQIYRSTPIAPIDNLQGSLSMTASCQPMETVAVFKIKAK